MADVALRLGPRRGLPYLEYCSMNLSPKFARLGWLAGTLLLALWSSSLRAENEGQGDLDKAVDLQISADNLSDLEKVADLCESAISKGLDDGNKKLAVQVLTSTLFQHATKLSGAIFEQQPPHQQWPQIRNLAVKDIERGFKYDTKNPDAHLLLAKLYALPGGDREKALKAAAEAIEQFGDDKKNKSKSLALRGALQTDAEKQLADFSAAIETDPSNVEAWQARGLYYLSKDQDEKAAEDFSKLLESDGDNLGALNALAEALTNLKKYDEALKLIDRVIKSRPMASLGYTARARIQILKGDEKAGLEDLNKALEMEPRDVAALLMRARYYYSQKKFTEAKADVEKALSLRPGMVQGILMRAVVAAEQGKYDEAIADMQMLSSADPSNVEWKLQIAQFYSADKRPRKAIEVANEVLKSSAENAMAIRIRGDAYLSIGKHAEAVADLETALKGDPKNSGILNNLAWVLSTSPEDNVRNGKRAIELALQACEATEYKRPHIISTLASAYAEAGDWDNAVKWSTKAIELSGDGEKEIVDQLKKELESYKEKKPFREKQETEEKPDKPKNPRPDLEI